MRVAALDLGTNTFLCLVADVESNGVVRVISDEAKVVRLGQGIHASRGIHPEALERADICLGAYAQVIRKHKAECVMAVATSAARDAINGEELIKIGRKHGIEIRIIEGETEAELTYRGVFIEPPRESAVILDVGGGSTEFILGDRSGIRKKLSLDVGSVRLTEAFVTGHPVSSEELGAMRRHLIEKFKEAKEKLSGPTPGRAIAVAGTPATIAALDAAREFDPGFVEGYRLSKQSLFTWAERLARMSLAERRALVGMEPGRADVVVAGALILGSGCEALGIDGVEVSVRGLRYGLAAAVALGARP